MSHFIIKDIKAREIIDSRGNPTIEVDVLTKNNIIGRASVPSGASTGKHEAVELRDKGKRYFGLGVKKAVDNVNNIIKKQLIGKNVKKQEELDKLMIKLDGRKNKSKLGANAILAVSIAIAKTASLEQEIPLYQHLANLHKTKSLTMPVPFMNVINGGKHAGNALDIQEYHIAPIGAKTFSEALQIGSEIDHEIKEVIKKKYGPTAINVGDEGGFAPPITDAIEPLNLMVQAVSDLGYQKKVAFALDIAASNIFKDGFYYIEGRKVDGMELVDFYKDLVKTYPIISIEDPFDEDNGWQDWYTLNKEIGNKIQILGDDLLVTNINRIKKALDLQACNALLLKMNQIGTLTESLEAAKFIRKFDWGLMVSHRSGETEDTSIADLAVGISAGQIKSGAPVRGERTAKYNQLLRIEEETKARYAGKNFKNPLA